MAPDKSPKDPIGEQIYLKVHQRQNKIIYAFADPEMVGNTYTNGHGLKLVIRPEFYEGKLIDLEDALDLLKRHNNSNIVGNLAKHAVQRGLIHRDCVLAFRDENTGKMIYHVMLMRV
ncbi:MAG: DUF424 family protein [Candidatus Odinarchaeota archaeon]